MADFMERVRKHLISEPVIWLATVTEHPAALDVPPCPDTYRSGIDC
ncbi:hypothetical protein [Streptomyces sp. WG5]